MKKKKLKTRRFFLRKKIDALEKAKKNKKKKVHKILHDDDDIGR